MYEREYVLGKEYQHETAPPTIELTNGAARGRRLEPQGLVVGGLDIFEMVCIMLRIVAVLLDHLFEQADGIPARPARLFSTSCFIHTYLRVTNLWRIY